MLHLNHKVVGFVRVVHVCLKQCGGTFSYSVIEWWIVLDQLFRLFVAHCVITQQWFKGALIAVCLASSECVTPCLFWILSKKWEDLKVWPVKRNEHASTFSRLSMLNSWCTSTVNKLLKFNNFHFIFICLFWYFVTARLKMGILWFWYL